MVQGKLGQVLEPLRKVRQGLRGRVLLWDRALPVLRRVRSRLSGGSEVTTLGLVVKYAALCGKQVTILPQESS